MSKVMVDRSAEKLELAKELGLGAYLQSKQNVMDEMAYKTRRKKIIAELTATNYKPLTQESFKFFPKWGFMKWQEDISIKLILSFLFTVLGLFLSALIASGLEKLKVPEPICLVVFLIGTISGFVGLHVGTRLRKVLIDDMSINEWKDELPYGAMLAMKEAKQKGIEGIMYNNHYKIYYPMLEKRVKADPIITGSYQGVEVVIFAWDDGKVYE